MLNQKVILETADKYLCEIILCEYPGKIIEKQYSVNFVNGRKLYTFKGLEEKECLDFIKEYRDLFEYRIVNADGKVIEQNSISWKNW